MENNKSTIDMLESGTLSQDGIKEVGKIIDENKALNKSFAFTVEMKTVNAYGCGGNVFRAKEPYKEYLSKEAFDDKFKADIEILNAKNEAILSELKSIRVNNSEIIQYVEDVMSQFDDKSSLTKKRANRIIDHINNIFFDKLQVDGHKNT